MRCARPMRAAIRSLLISCVSLALAGCVTDGAGVTPKSAVHLPPPPKFMGACDPSGVKAGDMPNVAFDLEHAAFKQCSRNGVASRSWYLGVVGRYGAAKLK
jgi:hypothetical protein